MNKEITKEIERINYNEKVKSVFAMIFAIIVFIVIGIVLVSAINITAGETYIQQLDKQYSYYEITNNLTEIELNVSWESPNAIIKIGKYVNDNFTITFYGKQDEVISSGGASGGSVWSYKKPINETINETIIDNVDEVIEDKEVEEEIVTTEDSGRWIYVGLIVVLGLIIYFYILSNKRRLDDGVGSAI